MKATRLGVCILCMEVFCKCAKLKKKLKKMSKFLKAQISGMAGTDLVCVCYQYATTCKVNLVLELQTGVKLYFVLRVNILMLCAHAPFSWTAWYITMCLENNSYLYYLFICMSTCEGPIIVPLTQWLDKFIAFLLGKFKNYDFKTLGIIEEKNWTRWDNQINPQSLIDS